ncbi:hypothetical protein ACFY5F_45435 [Streptomyces sp. NPDC013161]|uniref:hypothetical protein n=1 Tax=Streptomyces sp. NPDC013161 TaxID=3364862 RepID=UPI00368D76B1
MSRAVGTPRALTGEDLVFVQRESGSDRTGSSTMNSAVVRPRTGPAPRVATGRPSSSRPSPGSRSPCQAPKTIVYPRRSRQPLPASANVRGRFVCGASQKYSTARLSPRLPPSKNSRRRPPSTGRRISTSPLTRTAPSLPRGARPRSAIERWAGASGSTA